MIWKKKKDPFPLITPALSTQIAHGEDLLERVIFIQASDWLLTERLGCFRIEEVSRSEPLTPKHQSYSQCFICCSGWCLQTETQTPLPDVSELFTEKHPATNPAANCLSMNPDSSSVDGSGAELSSSPNKQLIKV